MVRKRPYDISQLEYRRMSYGISKQFLDDNATRKSSPNGTPGSLRSYSNSWTLYYVYYKSRLCQSILFLKIMTSPSADFIAELNRDRRHHHAVGFSGTVSALAMGPSKTRKNTQSRSLMVLESDKPIKATSLTPGVSLDAERQTYAPQLSQKSSMFTRKKGKLCRNPFQSACISFGTFSWSIRSTFGNAGVFSSVKKNKAAVRGRSGPHGLLDRSRGERAEVRNDWSMAQHESEL